MYKNPISYFKFLLKNMYSTRSKYVTKQNIVVKLNCVLLYFRSGFLKVGHDRYSGGHEQQRGKRGTMRSKGKPQGAIET